MSGVLCNLLVSVGRDFLTSSGAQWRTALQMSNGPAKYGGRLSILNGTDRARTCDLLRVKQALFQLSYDPAHIVSAVYIIRVVFARLGPVEARDPTDQEYQLAERRMERGQERRQECEEVVNRARHTPPYGIRHARMAALASPAWARIAALPSARNRMS